MKRVLTALALLGAALLSPSIAFAQAATPLPPPPPPPPSDPSTAPAVVPAKPPPPGVVYTPAPPPPQGQPQARPRNDDGDGDEKQIRKAENAVFLELGGSGLVYSINYERIFGDSGFSVRLGLSYISLGASSGNTSSKVSMMTFPVLANYYVGGRDHKLQLGLGVTFISITGTTTNDSTFVSASGFVPAPNLAIGYRYLPVRGGFTFFIGFTPFIIPGGDKVLFPWAGMSFGGVF